MAYTTALKELANRILRPVNLRLDTWTAQDAENRRIEAIAERGGFDSPLYELPEALSGYDPARLVSRFQEVAADLRSLMDPAKNSVGYSPDNAYFNEADASAYYVMLREYRPRRVIEIGSGNSTRVARQAIADGELETELISIDPMPRVDIRDVADVVHQKRLEEMDLDFFRGLSGGDFLFVDSSHEVFVGNDVATIYCRIIPNLVAGVIVHAHDIFLPFEYPRDFATAYPQWGEQYLLHALVESRSCEVLWPGHFLERSRPELRASLPFLGRGRAQSFWVRWC